MANERKIDMVILGLLSHEPLAGYDIKKRIDSSIRFFWKGSFGSIYPALNTMEKDGLIIKKESTEASRGKIVYSISDLGTNVLIEWLKNSQAKNELKYETLLKLFFGGVVDKRITISSIEAFENNVKQELELLRRYQDNLSKDLNNQDHIYYYLTVLFGVETYEGYLRWCNMAKEMLQD
jgi:DNA-binding PadR family transcriptional regulator